CPRDCSLKNNLLRHICPKNPRLVLLVLPRAPRSTLFPYTTLFRSRVNPMEPAIGIAVNGCRSKVRELGPAPVEAGGGPCSGNHRSEEHTSELQSLAYLVCRLLLEKKNSTSSPSLPTTQRALSLYIS